jgi:hypothetical protein
MWNKFGSVKANNNLFLDRIAMNSSSNSKIELNLGEKDQKFINNLNMNNTFNQTTNNYLENVNYEIIFRKDFLRLKKRIDLHRIFNHY